MDIILLNEEKIYLHTTISATEQGRAKKICPVMVSVLIKMKLNMSYHLP